MFKNVASQKLIVFAFDATTNLPKTGDAANITAYVSINYGAVTVLGDTSATEMDATNAKGYYLFDLTQGETNGDTLLFSAKSATANIVVVGAPATVFTDPPSYTSFVTPTNLTAAQIATGVWQDTTAGDFTVASSIGKALFTGNFVPGAAGGLFIAGTNAATTVNITGNITGNLTGSVGSVTGAVGSVTGNVGGNVVGSVASVTARVTSNVDQVDGAGLTAHAAGKMPADVLTVAGTAQTARDLGAQLDATVSSRSTYAGGAVASVTGNVGGNVVGSVASVVAAVAITSNIKKNQALARFEFLITDSTTHAPKTGAAILTTTRSIDGGAFAAGTLSAVTEVGAGIYYVDFGAGDLNGNVITLRVTATAADDVLERLVTQS